MAYMIGSSGILSSITEPTRNIKQTIGASSVSAAERRAETTPRKVIIIRNTSGAANQKITLHLGAEPAVLEEGIVLGQDDVYFDSTETGYSCWQGQINAICAVAGGQLSIFER